MRAREYGRKGVVVRELKLGVARPPVRLTLELEKEAWVSGVGFACFGGGQGVVNGDEFGVPGGLGVVFG